MRKTHLGLAAARRRLKLQEALAHRLADLHDRRHVACAADASTEVRCQMQTIPSSGTAVPELQNHSKGSGCTRRVGQRHDVAPQR